MPRERRPGRDFTALLIPDGEAWQSLAAEAAGTSPPLSLTIPGGCVTRPPVDISARIRGVKPRPTKIELCTDPEFRDAIDAVIEKLQAVDTDTGSGSLADGNDREILLAELAALNAQAEEAGAWMRIVLHAPGHDARVGYMAALASMGTEPDKQRTTMVAAEVAMLVSSVKEIDGEPANLTMEDARYILTEWDDELTRELIDAISDFAPEAASVPFSQRVSAILTTPMP